MLLTVKQFTDHSGGQRIEAMFTAMSLVLCYIKYACEYKAACHFHFFFSDFTTLTFSLLGSICSNCDGSQTKAWLFLNRPHLSNHHILPENTESLLLKTLFFDIEDGTFRSMTRSVFNTKGCLSTEQRCAAGLSQGRRSDGALAGASEEEAEVSVRGEPTKLTKVLSHRRFWLRGEA